MKNYTIAKDKARLKIKRDVIKVSTLKKKEDTIETLPTFTYFP